MSWLHLAQQNHHLQNQHKQALTERQRHAHPTCSTTHLAPRFVSITSAVLLTLSLCHAVHAITALRYSACSHGPASACPLQEEVILVENVRDDGCAAQIVFRLGGAVTAADLENLCSKVCLDCHVLALSCVGYSMHLSH